MNSPRLVITLTALLLAVARLPASGPLGIYGIVERVVFEPNETGAERIQVWGAFAYVDGLDGSGLTVSPAKRGYLYFRLPDVHGGMTNDGPVRAIKNEWADLKAVAGTGQAVGFGSWGYIGAFGELRPNVRSSMPPYILERGPVNPPTDLRVRPAAEVPFAPAPYQTDTGLVKLSEAGSHAAIVKQLKKALAGG